MHTRELDRRSLALLDKLVATMTPADLDLPTPCAGWTLADLLRHQVGENNGFAIAARHGSAPSWDGDLGDAPYYAYAVSVDAYLAAFADDAVLERTLTIGHLGDFPGHIAVKMHLIDTVVHGWDLAKTLGVPYEPLPEAVHEALEFAGRIPADPDVRKKRGTFAPIVELPEDASAFDRLLGILGRSPGWERPN
ncbi:TIGR03086 family metal-binding protein [Amycolatopsis sp. NPDC059027]|uniref:TIGR03086 family metal-binding protein n=1 Tax=Amycolatopsis sp. NPDC059027 TaxID=3346709 RepID=UPI0036723857